MAIPRVTVGDEVGLHCTLTVAGVAVPVDSSAVIKVSISDENRSLSYTGTIILDSADGNHDLPNGVVWVAIPIANTGTMKRGAASLEIEVNDPTKAAGSKILSWFHEVIVDLTAIT